MNRYDQIQRARALRRPFTSSPTPSFGYSINDSSPGSGSQGSANDNDDVVSVTSTIANFDFEDEMESSAVQETAKTTESSQAPAQVPDPLPSSANRVEELEQIVAIKDEYIRELQGNLSLYKVKTSIHNGLDVEKPQQNEEKILSLKKEIDQLKHELERKPMEINALENKVRELKNELENRPTEADINALAAALEKEKKCQEAKDYVNESLRDFISSLKKQSLQDLENIALLQTKLRDFEGVENPVDVKGNDRGLQEQNTTLALEKRKIKQELTKHIEALDDYKSQIKFLKKQNDKLIQEKDETTQEKDEALDKLNKALEQLKRGHDMSWSVMDYMEPSDLPVEATKYIANVLEEKKRSEATVFKLQAEVKRLHTLAFDFKAQDEKTQLISERFSLERELQILNEDYTNVNKALDELTLEHEQCEKIQKEHSKEIEHIKTKGDEELFAAVVQHSKEVEDLKNSHKKEIEALEAKCEKDVIAAVIQHVQEVEDIKKAKDLETQDLHKMVKKLEGESFPVANCSCSQRPTIESMQIKINELEGELWDYPDTVQELKRAKETIDKYEIKITDLLDEIDYGHDTYQAKIADLNTKVSELENFVKAFDLVTNTYENKIKELENQINEAQMAEAEGLFQPQNELGPEETREYLLPDPNVFEKAYGTYELKIKLLEERNTFLEKYIAKLNNCEHCDAKIKDLENQITTLLEESFHHDIPEEVIETGDELNANEFTVQIHIPSEILKVWNLEQDQSSWMSPMFMFDQTIDLICALYRPIPLALEFKADHRPANSNTMNFLNMFYFWKNLRRSPT